MRPRNTGVDGVAEEHVVVQVGVTLGVDEEGVSDSTSIEEKLAPVRSDHDDGSPRLDGGELIDRALDVLDTHILEAPVPSTSGWMLGPFASCAEFGTRLTIRTEVGIPVLDCETREVYAQAGNSAAPSVAVAMITSNRIRVVLRCISSSPRSAFSSRPQFAAICTQFVQFCKAPAFVPRPVPRLATPSVRVPAGVPAATTACRRSSAGST